MSNSFAGHKTVSLIHYTRIEGSESADSLSVVNWSPCQNIEIIPGKPLQLERDKSVVKDRSSNDRQTLPAIGAK